MDVKGRGSFKHLVRRIIEFFIIPSWVRPIISKYRELLGDENVVYTVLDRRHVVISFRVGGKWYRTYCMDGVIVQCYDEKLLSILKQDPAPV